MRHRLAIAFAATVFALIAVGLPCAARSGAPSAVHVAACGFEFDLPAGHRITRPKREEASGNRLCAFDVVPDRPASPPRGECKDKEDGGQPPYDVCDWIVDDGPPSHNVQAVRLRPGSRAPFRNFTLEDDGRWTVSNAQAGAQPADAFDFFGKPAWKGEAIVRLYWSRTRTMDYNGIYAGSGGTEVTLVQFAPDLFVELENPPLDEDGECRTFCASLRPGARAQDLP